MRQLGLLLLMFASALVAPINLAHADTPQAAATSPSVGYVFLGKCASAKWIEVHVDGLPDDCVIADTDDVRFKTPLNVKLREGMKIRVDHKLNSEAVDTRGRGTVLSLKGYHINYGFAWGLIDIPVAALQHRERLRDDTVVCDPYNVERAGTPACDLTLRAEPVPHPLRC